MNQNYPHPNAVIKKFTCLRCLAVTTRKTAAPTGHGQFKCLNPRRPCDGRPTHKIESLPVPGQDLTKITAAVARLNALTQPRRHD